MKHSKDSNSLYVLEVVDKFWKSHFNSEMLTKLTKNELNPGYLLAAAFNVQLWCKAVMEQCEVIFVYQSQNSGSRIMKSDAE